MKTRALLRAGTRSDDFVSVHEQRVRITHTLLTALGLAGVGYCVIALFLPDAHHVIPVVLAGSGSTLLLRRLADRGQMELAVLLLLLAISLTLISAVALDGNIGTTPMYLPVLVATAGASLYPRQVVWSVIGAIVVLLVMQRLSAPLQLPTTAHYLSVYAVIVTVLVGVISWVSARSVNQALRSAVSSKRRAEDLAADLEQRVAERTAELEAALSRQAELAAELAELSFRDPLTGLRNRRHLDDEIDDLFLAAKHTGSPLSVAIIDLDDFKSVNDRFTHIVGDDVLRLAAQLLVAGTRGSDVLVRMGGEEFALLMPNTEMLDGRRVCERMRTLLERHDWDDVMPGLRVTASFGLACSLDHATSLSLIRSADERLIHAKGTGKNQVVVSS